MVTSHRIDRRMSGRWEQKFKHLLVVCQEADTEWPVLIVTNPVFSMHTTSPLAGKAMPSYSTVNSS